MNSHVNVTVSLGDVAEVVMGQSPSGASYNLEGRGVPLLNGPTEFGPLHPRAIQWTSEPSRYCVPGDILFCVRGATTGRMNWADREYAIGRGLAAIRAKSGRADTKYLWYVLDNAAQALIAAAAGSTFVNLPGEKLLAHRFPLPPLPEQRRITMKLEAGMAAATRASAASEARLDAATKFPAALFREAFYGVAPLSVEAERPNRPPRWRRELLTNLARLESGHTPSRRRPEWWQGDVPWLALPDIRKLDGKVAMDTAEHTNQEGLNNSSARLLPENTVALSRTASVGFVTIFGRPMATSQDFVNWVCGPNLRPRFLMHLLRASHAYLRSIAAGATHKTIYMPAVESFRVCIPNVAEQDAIVAHLDCALDTARSLSEWLSQELDSIQALPGALLAETFKE